MEDSKLESTSSIDVEDIETSKLVHETSKKSWTERSNKLARRLDVQLLLPFSILYFLAYLDRSNLANAKTSISASLNLSNAEFAWASSIFQIGYIIFEVPSNIILKRSRPSLYLGLLVVLFGIVAMSTALSKDFNEIMVVRFFLGIAEAGFPPGVLFFLSYWYRKEELGQRNALFLVAGPLANAFGSIIAFGILQLNAGLNGWQWLFIIEGVLPVILGFAATWYIPDDPTTCRWFSPEDKKLAAQRVPLIADEPSNSREKIVWTDIFSLMTGVVPWSFALLNVSTNIASYGIGAFLPAIIQEMGYSSLEANLRTAPIYLFMAIFNITVATLSDNYGERGWVIVACLLGSAIGMFLLAFSILFKWALGVQYFLCFMLVFYSATSPIMIAWLQKAYKGSSDAAVGPAFVLTIGSLGGFVGPLIYGTTSDNNSYLTGHFIMGGVFVFGAMLSLMMRLSFVERKLDGRLVLRSSFSCCWGSKNDERVALVHKSALSETKE
jgi:MFS family permease